MLKIGIILAVALGVCTGFSSCAIVHDSGPRYVAKEPGPPPWAPAHGRRAKYRYHYYPDSHVYFDISRSLYFYPSGAIWRMSASLPGGVHIDVNSYSVLDMDADRPYLYHGDVERRYPPGQLKKGHGKWK